MAENPENVTRVYPPERSATVPCERCGGSGERPDRPPPGQRWAEPNCTSCRGTGELPRKHYAYCKRPECVGCLPTIDELDAMPNILDVFAEMLARCIPQSPETKTHDGAMAALRANRSEYETVAYFARRYSLLIQRLRPMLDGCLHDFDPECARCNFLTPVREAIAEADAR